MNIRIVTFKNRFFGSAPFWLLVLTTTINLAPPILVAGPQASPSAEKISIDDEEPFWLGIACRDLDVALQTHAGLDEGQGLLIYSIVPDSPASQAGVRLYDILLAIDDKDVGGNVSIESALKGKNNELQMVVLRAGKSTSINVTPAPRPEEQVRDIVDDVPDKHFYHEFLRFYDLVLKPLSHDAKKFLPGQYKGGVEVGNVPTGEGAVLAGFKKGDILIALDGWKVENLENVEYILNKQGRFDRFFLIRPSESGNEILSGSLEHREFSGADRMETTVAFLQNDYKSGFIGLTEMKMKLASLQAELVDFPMIHLESLDLANSQDRESLELEIERDRNRRKAVTEDYIQMLSQIRSFEQEVRNTEAKLEVAKQRLALWQEQSRTDSGNE